MCKWSKVKGIAKKQLTVILTASMLVSSNMVTAFAAETNAPVSIEKAVEAATEVETTADEAVDTIAADATTADEKTVVVTVPADETSEETVDEPEITTKAEDITSEDNQEAVESKTANDEIAAADDELEAINDETETVAEDEAEVTEDETEAIGTVSALNGDMLATTAVYSDSKVKATFTKNNTVQVSWKKEKGASTYEVLRMKADGTWTSLTGSEGIKKQKYIDTDAKSAETMAYKIIPMKNGAEVGEAKYAVATPVLTSVARDAYSRTDENVVRTMDVDLASVNGAYGYRVQKSMTKSKYFTAISRAETTYGVVSALDGSAIAATTGPVASFKVAGVKQTRIQDADDALNYGKVYYYKASAVVYVPEINKCVESAYSKVLGGKVTERAPLEVNVMHISGSRLLFAFEDMRYAAKNNKYQDEEKKHPVEAIASATDVYRIYAAYKPKNSETFTKYKKIAEMKANSTSLTAVKEGYTFSTFKELSDTDKAFEAPMNCVAYEVKNLKAETEYSFKVELVKSGVPTAKSESVKIGETILNDLTEIKANSDNFDKISATWKHVEGATGYNVYVKNVADADAANAAKANTSWISSAEKTWIKASPSKAGNCSTAIKKVLGQKLGNMEYYVIAVQPTGYKKGEHVQSQYAADWALTKIAAPKVTVKQSKDTLTFSWNSVSKASGYVVYCTKNGSTYKNNIFFDTDDKRQVEVSGLKTGEPVLFRVTTMYELNRNNFKTTENLKKWGNYTELEEGLAPTTPTVKAVLYNNVTKLNEDKQWETAGNRTGAKLMIQTSEASTKYSDSDTTFGFKVFRSHKKGSAFTEVFDDTATEQVWFDRSKALTVVAFRDDTDLEPGRTYYYRIYSVAKRNGNVTESREYTTATYCTPTDIKDASISVAEGASKDFTLTFKPSETTMTEVERWVICNKSQEEEKATEEAGTIETTYVKLTTSKYTTKVNCDSLSPKVTIKAKKKGTVYLKAEMVNGMTSLIKVKIEEKSDDNSSTGNGKCVVLDPGHGGADSGTTYKNLKEKEINLKVSKATKSYLNNKGYTVYMTRSDDTYLGLEERVTKYLNKKPLCIVSQHTNSSDKGASGIECWYSIDGTGRGLANKLSSKTADIMGMKNRGVKCEANSNGKDNFAIIRYGRNYGVTAVICENGFIQKDYDILKSDSKLSEIGEANGKAIHEWAQ